LLGALRVLNPHRYRLNKANLAFRARLGMGVFCARGDGQSAERGRHSPKSVVGRSRRTALFAASALLALTPALASETVTYSYDARGRLVKVAHSGTVNNGASACYVYDKADNRSTVDVETTSACTSTSGGGSGGGGNQPPVANPDSGSTRACGTVTVNVIANDTDPDGNYPLHIAGIVSATKGTVDSYTTTSITYTAAVSSGTGVVKYTVADSLGATSTGTLSIAISSGVCA
jgi:hypothetical protein